MVLYARKQRARRGFTLVEILLVVVIIAMLAAIVGPQIFSQSESSKEKITSTQIKTIQKALDAYALESGRYPSTEQGLNALVEKPEEDPPKKWVQQMEEMPLDPWDNEYQYAYPSTHTQETTEKGKSKGKPDVWSMGPDGEDDTEDDIVSWTVETEESESSSSRE
jgi:general secretion pathway protein G